jgi:putative FmdB family regulatory protein
MPTYPYKCNSCGTEFEILSRFDEREEKAVCPACGARDVETVMTSFVPIKRKI